jgi:hypothetical protein
MLLAVCFSSVTDFWVIHPGNEGGMMTTRSTLIVWGAGKIGRGFIADLFHHAGYHLVLVDQFHQPTVWKDGNTLGISIARQLRRVDTTIDIGNLGGGESHNLVPVVFPKIDVEIVEIPAGGPHDDHLFLHMFTSF